MIPGDTEGNLRIFEAAARAECHRAKPNLRQECASEEEYQFKVQLFVDNMKDQLGDMLRGAGRPNSPAPSGAASAIIDRTKLMLRGL